MGTESNYAKNILAEYLAVNPESILEESEGVLLYGDNKFVVGGENIILKNLVKMIKNNANKYVQKEANSQKLLELGLLKPERLNSNFEDIREVVTQLELLQMHSKGVNSKRGILKEKILSNNLLNSLDEKEALIDAYNSLKNNFNFANSEYHSILFNDILNSEEELSREMLKRANAFIHSQLDEMTDDTIIGILEVFGEAFNDTITEIASIITKNGQSNPDFVLKLMGSAEEFAHGFREIKGSYAACLDRKGNFVNIETYYICDVTGLI